MRKVIPFTGPRHRVFWQSNDGAFERTLAWFVEQPDGSLIAFSVVGGTTVVDASLRDVFSGGGWHRLMGKLRSLTLGTPAGETFIKAVQAIVLPAFKRMSRGAGLGENIQWETVQ